MSPRYVEGDATAPHARGVLVHCCNNVRAWGAGFTAALDKLGEAPRRVFLESSPRLGSVSFAPVPGFLVANIIGQEGIGRREGDIPPIRYEALRLGFNSVMAYIRNHGLPKEVYMPRLGCGLAGGDWALIEPLILATFVRSGFDVTVYTLPGTTYYDSRTDGPTP